MFGLAIKINLFHCCLVTQVKYCATSTVSCDVIPQDYIRLYFDHMQINEHVAYLIIFVVCSSFYGVAIMFDTLFEI